jgi:hypothetical protein
MKKKTEHYIEEIIFLFLILLNVLDFIEVLPGDIDFIKKLISWLGLGYLLYSISITNLFYGKRYRKLDIMLIIAYFFLIIKNLLAYVLVSREEIDIFSILFDFLYNNIYYIELTMFYVGSLLILSLALLFTFKIKVTKPSLFSIFNIHKKSILSIFILNFVIMISFFIIVFNLMMEWLAIAVDAGLIVVAILFYFFTLFRRHHKRFHPSTYVFKIGNFGEKFYDKFLRLFHSKKKIYLGISGMLVLHLLTDIGIFIIPYVVGFQDILYFGQLGHDHNVLYKIFIKDIDMVKGVLERLSLFWIYIFNILAMLFLLFSPAYIWYKVFKRKGIKINNILLSLFFIAVICFILSPAFRINPINNNIVLGSGLTGVDILTNSIFEKNLLDIKIVFLISLLIGVFVYFISYKEFFKKETILLGIALIIVFIAIYIFYFLKTILVYYSNVPRGVIYNLILSKHYFIVFYLILFLLITLVFYVIGYIFFLLEVKKEFKDVKKLVFK